MQLHSMMVSEPAGILTGFSVGLVVFHVSGFCGAGPHTSMVLGCIAHFLTNTIVAGHINLFLLDFLALALRLPAAAGSALRMGYLVQPGHLLH